MKPPNGVTIDVTGPGEEGLNATVRLDRIAVMAGTMTALADRLMGAPYDRAVVALAAHCLTVDCPTCGRLAGHECITLNAAMAPTKPHQRRVSTAHRSFPGPWPFRLLSTAAALRKAAFELAELDRAALDVEEGS